MLTFLHVTVTTSLLKRLAEAGILTDMRAGRERLFINHAFLEILNTDEYFFPAVSL